MKDNKNEAYIKKAKYYTNLSKRRDEQRAKLKEAKEIHESERLSNLSKLLSKGEITQQEYDLKTVKPKAKRTRRSIVEVKEIMI
jgi:hypothetical protein